MAPNLVNHEAVEATAAAWLARKDNLDNWTERDEQALDAWLGEHTAHQVAWLRLQHAWVRADRLAPLRAAAALPTAVEAAVPARRHWFSRPSFRYASLMAGLAGAVLIGGHLAWQPSPAGDGEDRYVTAVGARQTLTLNDGSRVTLNTRTKARALVSHDGRRFWVDEGEAFFEIQHDPDHPFVVTAGKDRITVLGTKFSVRHEGGRTQVTVLEGRVKLEQAPQPAERAPSAAVSTLLVKNDSAVAQAGSVLVATKTSAKTQSDLSWREGRLEFDNTSLADIATEFNRYNKRQLVVLGDASSIRLSGRFETYNIDGLVRLIHSGFGVTVREEGDRIELSSS
ncbi:FecR family protein [Roseateles sp. P5_E11]